jgi:hypothetical protein
MLAGKEIQNPSEWLQRQEEPRLHMTMAFALPMLQHVKLSARSARPLSD